MKRFLLIVLALMTAVLFGCNKALDEPLPENSIAYNENGEVIDAPEKTENAGSEAAQRADSGVKITYNVPEGIQAAGLKKTVLTYFFEDNKICALKVENTYDTPESANNAAKDFAIKPESCREVTVFGNTVRYYSSESGISGMSEMTKESLKDVAENIGGAYEEF